MLRNASSPERGAFSTSQRLFSLLKRAELVLSLKGSQGGYQLAKELFQKPLDYTAIFASTDSNALGVLTAADELGIDIPGRLSLIGFDNISATALSRIDLTTIDQPKKAMAVQAVDMLRDKIEHGTQGYVHQILLPTLIRRGTCKEPFSR